MELVPMDHYSASESPLDRNLFAAHGRDGFKELSIGSPNNSMSNKAKPESQETGRSIAMELRCPW
jgi:hypothetical protein